MVTRESGEIADFDAAAEWVGMPDWQPGTRMVRLMISFAGDRERQAFMERNGFSQKGTRKQGNIWSVRWPPRQGKDDLRSLRVE
jgi:hypothetical protein